MITPVILSGGSGTRMWPLSRGMHPKQFLPLVTDQSMLQDTLTRLEGLELTAPLVVSNNDHRFMVAEQLRELDQSPLGIVLEPVGRNTAPAVAVAALKAQAEDLEAVILVLPADHVIDDQAAFVSAVNKAASVAATGKLVTFGIVPTGPETGYGYIRGGDAISTPGLEALGFDVAEFVEKPDLATAKRYVSEGYYWNSGMFIFQASRYLEELEKFAPAMLASCRESLSKAKTDLDFIRLDQAAFAACEEDSIDYAVMEKTDSAIVIPLDAGWNDVGSWSALWEVSEKDDQGNAIHGDVLTHDTSNSFLHAENKLIATVGVKDLVVIETADAVMVAHKSRVQEVKEIVAQLKEKERPEAHWHRKVYRPWGYYDSVDEGERHQTKRIVVNPGAKLSLQKHHHRAEHWIVVKGTALVTKGDEKLLVGENESTYIPLGVVHSLENPGVIPLEMIEVQSGSYLGEDDIVRYEDKYGRA